MASADPKTDTATTSDRSSGEDPGSAPSWLVARGLLLERGPRRTLATASFVNMVGSGVFMISAALFFTRSVGLSLSQVGVGMGIGALVGLLSGIPVGRLADRRGPREVYLMTLTAQALAMAALVLVHSFWVFVLVVCLTELAGSASQAARAPLTRGLAGPKPAAFRAYLRAVVNLAGSLGAVLAALVVQLDTRTAYVCLVLGNALSFLAAALLARRLPSLPPVPPPPGGERMSAARDHPFLVYSVLAAITALQGDVLLFALPLWIVEHTHAPRWLVGASALANTLLVVFLQVRVSRGIDTNATAARAWRRSGWAFLVGMTLIGLTAGLPGGLAVLLIALGAGVHTVGEIWQAAGSFQLKYALAPAHAQGQYTGIARIGNGLADVAAPSVLGYLCVSQGTFGWLLMGGVFVAAGLAIPPVVRWAERAHPDRVTL
ncbi:MFS family permease [Kitasatospora sp. GAS204A]|uniref:MFS transporter n=1 Tax=unclassified Kitasatospora TaxID=2633591 RepID=UPI002474DCA9|nr:MFS transporter [Kitasatospora sp. GAS204B]MDH6120756.1 MFS family permease [Kitasatospora sp. GAS204B]